LNDIYLPQIRNEHQTTRRVIAAIPAGQCEWRPDAKCMSAIELAWHMVTTELFFLKGMTAGKFERGDTARPDNVKTPADVLQWDDAHFENALAAFAAVSANELTRPIDFFGFMTMPGIMFSTILCSHSIHHRGQLSSYLRPMGGKVPRIYGPSGDEPMSM